MHTDNKSTNVARMKGNEGFTLIETMIAMVVLTVGIFALYSMQTTSIRYNASANAITGSSTWAADRIEQLLESPYDNIVNGNEVRDRYAVSWTVTNSLTPNPSDPSASTVKAVRVLVQHNDFGVNKQVVLNYYKQKVF